MDTASNSLCEVNQREPTVQTSLPLLTHRLFLCVWKVILEALFWRTGLELVHPMEATLAAGRRVEGINVAIRAHSNCRLVEHLTIFLTDRVWIVDGNVVQVFGPVATNWLAKFRIAHQHLVELLRRINRFVPGRRPLLLLKIVRLEMMIDDVVFLTLS